MGSEGDGMQFLVFHCSAGQPHVIPLQPQLIIIVVVERAALAAGHAQVHFTPSSFVLLQRNACITNACFFAIV